jgi:hypothetical protein
LKPSLTVSSTMVERDIMVEKMSDSSRST